jgi:hypothetical protein
VPYRFTRVISPIPVGFCLFTFFAPNSAVAQPPDTTSPTAQIVEQTQHCSRHLDDKLTLWRERLKLQDWQVFFVFTRRADLKSRTLGGIRWDKKKKTAVISVLDPSEYRTPLREMLDDMEFTVVHELVHLQLASLPRSEASRSSEEHAVNRITEALLTLDRQR